MSSSQLPGFGPLTQWCSANVSFCAANQRKRPAVVVPAPEIRALTSEMHVAYPGHPGQPILVALHHASRVLQAEPTKQCPNSAFSKSSKFNNTRGSPPALRHFVSLSFCFTLALNVCPRSLLNNSVAIVESFSKPETWNLVIIRTWNTISHNHRHVNLPISAFASTSTAVAVYTIGTIILPRASYAFTLKRVIGPATRDL